MIEKPWIAGPKELLLHVIHHLDLNTGFDNRIAIISIDNSVELMIKTYLGLPKRISKIEGLTRKILEDTNATFPNLLDGLEKFANNKLDGIDLGDIEWFHRLRNQLYHDGNGITVEKEKVETYAELAKILFSNLFEIEIEDTVNEVLHHSLVGEFIKLWADLERKEIQKDGRKRPLFSMLNDMLSDGRLSSKQAEIFKSVRVFRNELVHGMSSPTEKELKLNLNNLKNIIDML